MRGSIVKQCPTCGRDFKAYLSLLAKGKGLFCSRPCRFGPMPERFWSRVDKNGPVLRAELGNCWTWTGTRTRRGYGMFHIGSGKRARPGKYTFSAHRVAFFITHGRWPEPQCLHHCDGGTAGCVRPDHLYEGTVQDNARDYADRGDHSIRRGERNPIAKINDSTVREIRQRFASGERPSAIASSLGITISHVSSVAHRRSWKHVV